MDAVPTVVTVTRESRDGHGAGDRDLPFAFGTLPRAAAPFPFSTRQFARLLILRGRVQDGCYEQDRDPPR